MGGPDRDSGAFLRGRLRRTVLFQIGDDEDAVARLALDDARFWVGAADPGMRRLGPAAIDEQPSRTLLVVDDPDAVIDRAAVAGATPTSPATDEHGWRFGPIGHE